MNRAFPCLAAIALPLGLSACASSGDYPSLARRDAERISGSAPVVSPSPAPSPSPAAPSADVSTRLSQLVEQARTAHERFAEKRSSTERIIAGARGAAVASESWSVATVALADLNSTRNGALVALSELDGIYAAEAVKAAETGNMGNADAAAAAHEQISALVAEEEDVLDRLRGRL